MSDTLDVERLLAPVSDERPAGVDLEFDAELQALEAAAEGTPERTIGDTRIPAEDPNWGDLVDRCTELLARSKDLSVAAKLCRASLALDGVAGLAAGFAVIDGVLERYWDTCYPQLVADDSSPAEMRVNALSELATPAMVTRVLDAPWIKARDGVLRVRDVLVGFGRMHTSDPENATTESAVRATVAGLSPDARSAARALALEVRDRLAQIIARFEEHRQGSQDLFQPSRIEGPLDMLRSVVDVLIPPAAAPAATPAPTTATGGTAAATPTAAAEAAVATNGEFRSRAQIAEAIDRMCDYFARSEPSSPVPLILMGAKRMLSMTFLELTTSVPAEVYQRFSEILGSRKSTDGSAAGGGESSSSW